MDRQIVLQRGALGLVLLAYALLAVAVALAPKSATTMGDVLASPDFAIALATPVVGGSILLQQPRNRMGWMFLAMGLASAAFGFATIVPSAASLTPGATAFLDWLTTWVWYVSFAGAFVVVPMLFPTGRLPSPRWRWVGRAAAAVLLTHVMVLAVVGDAETVDGAVGVLETALFAAVPVLGAVALASLFSRFRGATVETRSQLVLVVVAAVAGLAVLVVTGQGQPLALMLPLAVALAVGWRGLYDVERSAVRVLSYALVTGVVFGVFAVVVAGAGTVLLRGEVTLPLLLIASALAVTALGPIVRTAERVSRRIVLGVAADPYASLTGLSQRLSGALVVDDVLPSIAATIGESTRARRVEVLAARAGLVLRQHAWGCDDVTGPADVERIVSHGGRTVGEIRVWVPAGGAVAPGRVALIRDLVEQSGAALANVVLASELADRIDVLSSLTDELERSRGRLITAQHDAMRAIQRDLHDGAQQQLLALSVDLSRARRFLAGDVDAAAELIDRATDRAQDVMAELRRLSSGAYPPALEELGVVAALRRVTDGAPVPVTIEGALDGRADGPREAALYFAATEAVQNAVKHAGATAIRIRVGTEAGAHRIVVTDDGRGFDPATAPRRGLLHQVDRLAAVGGWVDIHSGPGEGTTVTLALPAGASRGAHDRTEDEAQLADLA